MTQPQTVTVKILDKDYPIHCPPQQRANLESAARYLDGKMREIRNSGKVIGADRIAVLAALNIAHELLQQQGSAVAGDTREQVRELLERVDRALQEEAEQRQG
ncbi:cell division protein ZapA [Pseudomonas linyingensis]|jgi:cell division protein ZapA|uniref:Cell division protein ZapA n=1 Tax=Pseudomonas linyingensis TaxID=915471 RepID=A0A1H7AUL2_9PSED|nr:cell division protein ZapA [Pseudomonas linyingensis]SEJ68636.1 cell division protein ZapA [Pseudomonas linyingensis]